MSRAEIETRYTALSDRDLSAIPYYKAFGFWRLACILQGVYARYAGGGAAGDRSRMTGLPQRVIRMADRALVEVESRLIRRRGQWPTLGGVPWRSSP
jgi:hypothetical protein